MAEKTAKSTGGNKKAA